MELTRVILGPVVTEKSERLKSKRTYILRVHPDATKIDIRKALAAHYDVEVTGVRVMTVRPKSRMVGFDRSYTKRHGGKKAIVTLASQSKPLDIAQFKS